MNPVEIAALDALDLLVVVDNEIDTLSSVDKGVPQLPELGRLVARVPHLAPKDGHDCVEPWGDMCLACHGFSALVNSLSATPASPSFKIATICDSVNLDFLMTSPVPGESTIYLYPSRGSLRFRCGNATTERPIFQTCGHGETDEDIVTRNSRRGSKFVRKTRQEGLLFAPTPRV